MVQVDTCVSPDIGENSGQAGKLIGGEDKAIVQCIRLEVHKPLHITRIIPTAKPGCVARLAQRMVGRT